jgi:hypothetical protein
MVIGLTTISGLLEPGSGEPANCTQLSCTQSELTFFFPLRESLVASQSVSLENIAMGRKM